MLSFGVTLTVFPLFLSATDAKERQHWVSRLQICTQHHTEAMGKVRGCVQILTFGRITHFTLIP